MHLRSIVLRASVVLLGLQCSPALAPIAATSCLETPSEAEAPREPDATPAAPRLSAALVGGEFVHVAQPGDSLTLVGARFGVDVRALAERNGLSPQATLQVGQHLRVVNLHIVPGALLENGMVINVPQRMLFHFRHGDLAGAHTVGLGRTDWPTPIGVRRVTSLERDKVWYVPPSIQREMEEKGQVVVTRVEPGPDNPLGGLWLGLDRRGYGIHATLAPQSLYAFRSHGCIRMHRDDLELLFDSAAVGDEVRIVYWPNLLTRTPDGRILLEAHPDAYDLRGLPILEVRTLAAEHALENEIDWERVAQVIEAREGVPRDVRRQQASEE